MAYGEVMAVTAAAAKGRGRPREFDEEEVLSALVELFWDRGFEAASLNEIVDATGLNKSSLYNAFGSKEAVFARALDKYLEVRKSVLDEHMAEGGLDTVLGFVEMVRAEATSDSGFRGCMAVNASTELGLRDAGVAEVSNRFRTLMRDGLRAPLERAAADGEIDSTLIEAYIDMLMSFAMAVSVASRGGADEVELDRILDSMRSLVESWRLG